MDIEFHVSRDRWCTTFDYYEIIDVKFHDHYGY